MNANTGLPLEWKMWVFKSVLNKTDLKEIIETLASNKFNKEQINNAIEIGLQTKNPTDIKRLNAGWQQWIATNIIQGASKESVYEELIAHNFKDYEIINEIELARNNPYVKACIESTIKLKKRDWLLATCDHLAQLDPTYTEKIDEIETPPFKAFIKNYYSKHKLVVLKNGIEHWNALDKWTPEYFAKEFGNETVQIQFNRDTDKSFEMKSYKFRKTLKMRDFVKMIEEGGETNNY